MADYIKELLNDPFRTFNLGLLCGLMYHWIVTISNRKD